MTKEDKPRKNFPTKIVEEVFEEQGRCCDKCSRSLMNGFHIHHKDGNNANIEKENCQLLCSGCHGGEQYKTLQDQKKIAITDLEKLIQVGVEGKVSGSTLEKILDAIKLKLSLQRQVLDDPPMEIPSSVKAETYVTVMEHGLKEREYGFKTGLEKGIDLAKELIKDE